MFRRSAEVRRVPVGGDWLGDAVEALDADGAVVLTSTGLAEAATAIGEQMLGDVERLLAHLDDVTVYADGHLRQLPDTGPGSRVVDVLGCPALGALAEAVLGPGCAVADYLGHTVLPGSSAQPVHADWEPLWPDFRHYHPPFLLAYNLALVPTTERNGAMELWPGTHRIFGGYDEGTLVLGRERVSARRRRVPPVQVRMDVGDLLVRDVRTWHRGTRNASAAPRPIIFGLIAAAWYRYQATRPLTISAALAGRVAALGLAVRCRFTDEEIDRVVASIDA